ncbi:MAG: hypothetical protein HQK57_04415 [Deltaproteobacteria bacterium]|nr:hypothetical protein [Deltaproteobacteria bacterium]MBF0524995.1 hypothetical protein [Deltaproteobacteria bacterium]
MPNYNLRNRFKAFLSRSVRRDPGESDLPPEPPVDLKEKVPQNDNPSGELSQRALSISERLGRLRELFSFSPGLESRLETATSIKEVVAFVNEVLLSRFSMLKEIGLLNPESAKALEAIGKALETVREKKEFSDKLLQENESLKKKLEVLEAQHITPGVITDRELRLEKQLSSMQRRERELRLALDRANKKIVALRPTQELARSLTTKNSLLTAKLEHQSGLMRSLTADNQKYQDLLIKVQNLREENQELKKQIEEKPGMFGRIKSIFSHDSALNESLHSLISNHDKLNSELEENELILENIQPPDSGSGLVDAYDRLDEQNIALKRLAAAKASLDNLVTNHQSGKQNLGQIIQHLQAENQNLKQALTAKQEKIKILKIDPAQQQLMRKLVQLKNEYNHLLIQFKTRSELAEQLEQERAGLLAKLSEQKALVREQSQLKAKEECVKRLADSARQLEAQYKSLKKKYLDLSNENQITLTENTILNRKLSKVTTEYDALIKEYENIFQSIQ